MQSCSGGGAAAPACVAAQPPSSVTSSRQPGPVARISNSTKAQDILYQLTGAIAGERLNHSSRFTSVAVSGGGLQSVPWRSWLRNSRVGKIRLRERLGLERIAKAAGAFGAASTRRAGRLVLMHKSLRRDEQSAGNIIRKSSRTLVRLDQAALPLA